MVTSWTGTNNANLKRATISGLWPFEYWDSWNMDGKSGNDTIYGGAKNDTISGGSGKDRLHGEEGNDTLNGGSGNDTLYASFGNDYSDGGSGNDKIYGGDGTDTLLGHFGNDYIHGGYANDSLYGEDGNDTLNGGFGDDYIHGGSGKDTLNGEPGYDTLYGGSDADLFIVPQFSFAGTGYTVISDFKGAEGDKVDLTNSYNNYTYGTGNYAGSSSATDTLIYANGNLIAVVADTNTGSSSFVPSVDIV